MFFSLMKNRRPWYIMFLCFHASEYEYAAQPIAKVHRGGFDFEFNSTHHVPVSTFSSLAEFMNGIQEKICEINK